MDNFSLRGVVSNEFLHARVEEMDEECVTAIILGGSQARGDATRYSDVDFMRFVRSAEDVRPKRYVYRDGRLVSIGTRTIEKYRAGLQDPEAVIFVVPSMREACILLDKEGEFARFQQEVRAFTWEPLQKRANEQAGTFLMLFSEYAHKVLGSLLMRDELALAAAVNELLYQMTLAVAIQRGVLIESGNSYFRQVEHSVGFGSSWTRYHLIVAGLEQTTTDKSFIEERALAALRLYQETLAIMRDALLPIHREVAEQTSQIIEEALSTLYGRYSITP